MSSEPTRTAAASIESQRVLDAQNPWPGLDAFDENAAAFFNGRETEATELAHLVGQGQLTILFGKSGLGKTSLLQAGLFPMLRAEGVFPIYVRLAVREREGALIDQLTTALLRESGIHRVQVSPAGFDDALWERLHLRDFALWSTTNRPLMPMFVLDQFEEVFTLGAANREAVERLRIDLADLIENRIPAPVVAKLEASPDTSAALDVRRQRYKVLLSFREDFLPEIEAWRSDLPSLMRNRFRLGAMNAAQAFAAVYDTGSAAGVVDERTAREIVRFVGKIQSDDRTAAAATRSQQVSGELEAEEFRRHDVEPALLSLVCAELNKRRQKTVPPRPSIDAELLRGTAASIISAFYLRQVATVPAATRRFIEEELLTEGGYRSSFPMDEALTQGSLTDEILRRLVDGRLLRIEHQLGVPRVELTHDRLTDVVGSERDRRRAKERTAGRRRSMQLYGAAAVVAVMLILFGAFNWVAKTASDSQRLETEKHRRLAVEAQAAAESERDEADRLRVLAEQARAQAQTERDDANRQRERAEAARKAVEEARARAEQQRLLAEQRQRQILAEQEKGKRQSAVVGELYAPIRPGVLRIEVGEAARATGFFVTRSGLAVTTAHVVEAVANARIQAVNFDGNVFGATVVKLDKQRDLALLRISGAANTPCLQFADTQVALGTAVVALSMSDRQNWMASTGAVRRLNVSLGGVGGLDDVAADSDLIEVDLDAAPGFSGAPVMDPYARRVIGLGAYAKQGDAPRHYLIPASRIRAAFGRELADGCSGS